MQKTEKIFKNCPMCASVWRDRHEFLNTPNVRVRGYQADLDEINNGMFLFNHLIQDCGTTFAVPVYEFLDLYKGEIYPDSKFGTDDCEGHCLDIGDLDRCNASCKNAYVREILQILKK